jgi:hypothetical protein
MTGILAFEGHDLLHQVDRDGSSESSRATIPRRGSRTCEAAGVPAAPVNQRLVGRFVLFYVVTCVPVR